jgi:hypothetical protein
VKKLTEIVDAITELRRFEEGIKHLFNRNPGLFVEFSKATKEELQNDWIYELDQNGIPIIEMVWVV